MSPEIIEREARAKYDACPTVKPDWSQLGEITKSVWRELVVRTGETPDNAAPAAEEPPATGPSEGASQSALF